MQVSYTMLSTYKRCHRRAYLQYVKKLVPFDKVDHRPFIVGIVADWLFKEWVKGGYQGGWMEWKADGIFEWFARKRNIRYLGAGDKEKLKRKLTRAVVALECVALGESLPHRNFELQSEVGYAVEGGYDLTGKLDMWFPDEKAIYDLKITESTRYLDSFQLEYFAWLMERKTGVQVERLVFMSPLMSPSIREVPWLPGTKICLETDVMSMLGGMAREEWEITAKDCWGCPVVKFCEDSSVEVSRTRSDGGGFKLDLGGEDEGF